MLAGLFSKHNYQGRARLVVISPSEDSLSRETRQQLVCSISDFHIKVWRAHFRGGQVELSVKLPTRSSTQGKRSARKWS